MGGSETRARLISAGIELFGRDGLDAVGIDALARSASVETSTISYHFATKDALYVECAKDIADYLVESLGSILDHVGYPRSLSQARSGIEAIIRGLVAIMLTDEMAPIARFIIREQMNPTLAFAIIYNSAIRHFFEQVDTLMEMIASDRVSKDEVAVRCHAMIGQVLGLRFAKASLLNTTGWSSFGPTEVALILHVVLSNVRAMLTDLETRSSR